MRIRDRLEHDLERLIRAGAVDYRPGRTVLKVSEQGNKVEVLCHTDGEVRTHLAGFPREKRAELDAACPPDFIYDIDGATVMKTTQGFITPMLRFRGASFSLAEREHGFFKPVPSSSSSLTSDNWIHAQISAPNELALAKLANRQERLSPEAYWSLCAARFPTSRVRPRLEIFAD